MAETDVYERNKSCIFPYVCLKQAFCDYNKLEEEEEGVGEERRKNMF